jgi:hypothetical protein
MESRLFKPAFPSKIDSKTPKTNKKRGGYIYYMG